MELDEAEEEGSLRSWRTRGGWEGNWKKGGSGCGGQSVEEGEAEG